MNDTQLRRSLQSIGKACFVNYFQQFCDNTISREDLIELLMRNENYMESGCITRLTQARRIIAGERALDALHIVASSGRVSFEVSKEARRLADSLQRHPQTTFPTASLAVPMTNSSTVGQLEAECQALFSQLAELQKKIREKVSVHADGKNLKGNELVGWLGEIYGKLLLNGTLVNDREEHDFVTVDGRRVSVKTRKGRNSGWKQTSAIPRIEGSDCPTHVSVQRIPYCLTSRLEVWVPRAEATTNRSGC